MLVLWLKLKARSKWPTQTFPQCHSILWKTMKGIAKSRHHQKAISKTGRRDKSFKLEMLSSKHHVPSLSASPSSFYSEVKSFSRLPRKIYDWKEQIYLAVGACKVCSLSWQAQLLFILQMLILDSVNHCTFLLLGEGSYILETTLRKTILPFQTTLSCRLGFSAAGAPLGHVADVWATRDICSSASTPLQVVRELPLFLFIWP